MRYITVLSTWDRNQIIIVKTTLEQNNIKCRILDTHVNNYFSTGVRVQVPQKHQKRAIEILRENGFFRKGDEKEEVSELRFWIYLVLALIFIILAAIVINLMMPA